MLLVFDGSSKLSLCVLCFFAYLLPHKVVDVTFLWVVSGWTLPGLEYSFRSSLGVLYFEFITYQLNLFHAAGDTDGMVNHTWVDSVKIVVGM